MIEGATIFILILFVVFAVVYASVLYGDRREAKKQNTPVKDFWDDKLSSEFSIENLLVMYETTKWQSKEIEVRDINNTIVGNITYNQYSEKKLIIQKGQEEYFVNKSRDKLLSTSSEYLLFRSGEGAEPLYQCVSDGLKTGNSEFLLDENKKIKVSGSLESYFKECYEMQFYNSQRGLLYRKNSFVCAIFSEDLSDLVKLFLLSVEYSRFLYKN